jgi:AbrB family looped-hinge helix DNA binding protein
METATLSSKFQILIPKAIRESLDLKAGQKLTFVVKGNYIQLLPEKKLEEMRGFLKGANTSNVRDRKDRI